MAEPAIALREHPQIIELFTVLEQNGLHQQKDEVQALVSYIDGMEDKLSRMVDEMTAMRKEVDQLHDRSIQARCTFLMNEAENKVHQVSSMVSTAKNNTISAAGRMVQTFHEKGRVALRIPAVLTRMEHGFSHASQTMEKCAGRMDVIREELHQAGGHLKSAGRALTGKEAQQVKELDADKGVLAKLRGFLTSCGKAFSEMERGAGRLAEKAGGEKASVKTELMALKAAPSGQHRADPGKDKAR